MGIRAGSCLFLVLCPHHLLFGCSRGAGAKAAKKHGGRATCCPNRASLGLGLVPGTLLGTPEPRMGHPHLTTHPKAAVPGGSAHVMVVLQQRQSSGKGKESRESQWPSWPPRVPSWSLSSFPGPGEPEEAGRQPARMLEQR